LKGRGWVGEEGRWEGMEGMEGGEGRGAFPFPHLLYQECKILSFYVTPLLSI